MSDIEELRRRLEALEAEVTTLREDAATTRALAAMNDRDVAEFRTELRAHRQVLGALRETQLEQNQKIDALEAKVDALEGKLDRGFATVLSGIQAITDRLDTLGEPGDH